MFTLPTPVPPSPSRPPPLPQAYQGFQDTVRASVPPEQLLVYKVEQGWGPLCDALGLPVPDTPFPNVNDSMEFQSG